MTPTRWGRAWRGAPSAARWETSPTQVQPQRLRFHRPAPARRSVLLPSSTQLGWRPGDKKIAKCCFPRHHTSTSGSSRLNPLSSSLVIGLFDRGRDFQCVLEGDWLQTYSIWEEGNCWDRFFSRRVFSVMNEIDGQLSPPPPPQPSGWLDISLPFMFLLSVFFFLTWHFFALLRLFYPKTSHVFKKPRGISLSREPDRRVLTTTLQKQQQQDHNEVSVICTSMNISV